MNFQELAHNLQQRLSGALPGAAAHEALRATPVGAFLPRFDHKLPPRPGGVLILLYEEDGQLRFPVIKRQVYLGAHSGQVSLPGGKAEPGEDPVHAALREGEEEIGIDRHNVQVLGRLSDFFVIPSNFIITPVVATLHAAPRFTPDAYEVAKILTGTLDGLLQDDAVQQSEILAAGQFRMQAPHFTIEGEVVWGATAMMLNEFRMVLRDAMDPGGPMRKT